MTLNYQGHRNLHTENTPTRSPVLNMNIISFLSTCQEIIQDQQASYQCSQLISHIHSNLSEAQTSLRALNPQEKPGDALLFRSSNLFIFKSCLMPNLRRPPLTNGAWDVVKAYEGQEDNIFHTRNNGGPEETGRKHLTPGKVMLLGLDTIHAGSNPLSIPNWRSTFMGPIFSLPLGVCGIPGQWRSRLLSSTNFFRIHSP